MKREDPPYEFHIRQDVDGYPELTCGIDIEYDTLDITHMDIITGEAKTIRHLNKVDALRLADWIIHNAHRIAD